MTRDIRRLPCIPTLIFVCLPPLCASTTCILHQPHAPDCALLYLGIMLYSLSLLRLNYAPPLSIPFRNSIPIFFLSLLNPLRYRLLYAAG